jgi:hypothetical protein
MTPAPILIPNFATNSCGRAKLALLYLYFQKDTGRSSLIVSAGSIPTAPPFVSWHSPFGKPQRGGNSCFYESHLHNVKKNNHNRRVLQAELVNEGIRLDRHYVFRYCSPTRRSFLSGRFPNRITSVQPDGCVRTETYRTVLMVIFRLPQVVSCGVGGDGGDWG